MKKYLGKLNNPKKEEENANLNLLAIPLKKTPSIIQDKTLSLQ